MAQFDELRLRPSQSREVIQRVVHFVQLAGGTPVLLGRRKRALLQGHSVLTFEKYFDWYVMAIATEIIHEIDGLLPTELAVVVRHAKELDKHRQLSGDELGMLAQQMVDATDPDEVERLKAEITRGFYGNR